MYMQGIQDYVNWLIHSMQEYIQPQSEELLNIKKKIYDITERVFALYIFFSNLLSLNVISPKRCRIYLQPLQTIGSIKGSLQ